MRCREAKHKLLENGELSRELIAHLMQCPNCSLLAEAQNILQESFETIRIEQDSDVTPLSVLKAEMATRKPAKEINFMANVGKSLTQHPRLGISFGLGIALMLFVVLVPFSYQKTVGYQIEFAIGDSQLAPKAEALNNALGALGYNEAKATFSSLGNSGKYLISVLPNMKAVRETQALFASILGTFSSPKVSPIVETISGSLYAQVKDKMVKIEIDATNKTDEEIQNEIKSKLTAQGIACDIFYVKTDKTNQGSDSTKQIKFECVIKGDTGLGGQEAKMIQIDGRGKTEEQIQTEIKARLAEKGMPDCDVDVNGSSTDSTNCRRIEIKIKEGADKK
jgi:hypothetical protein